MNKIESLDKKPLGECIVNQLERLKNPLYCTVATVDNDGYPWSCPVYFAQDSEGNIYWTSAIDTQHSININNSGKVFISIFKENIPEGGGDSFGLYMRGSARQLEDITEIAAARIVTCGKLGKEPKLPAEAFAQDSLDRVYKFTPESAWVNYSKSKIDIGTTSRCDMRVNIQDDQTL